MHIAAQSRRGNAIPELGTGRVGPCLAEIHVYVLALMIPLLHLLDDHHPGSCTIERHAMIDFISGAFVANEVIA